MYNKILSTLFNWIVVFGRQWMLHSDTLTLPAQPTPQFINKAMGGRLGSVQGRLVLLLWSCSKWKARVQTQTVTHFRAPGQSPALPVHPRTSELYFHFHWTVPTLFQRHRAPNAPTAFRAQGPRPGPGAVWILFSHGDQWALQASLSRTTSFYSNSTMKRSCRQTQTPSWTNPLVKQSNIHLSFQKQRRKEHTCIFLDISLDCLFCSNNANSRCSFPPIKKSQLDGLYFDLFRTKSVCKIYWKIEQISPQPKQGERKAESYYPVISVKCLWGGGKHSDMEGCHLKLRSQAPPTGREGTLVQS